jgi:hypothetical protein
MNTSEKIAIAAIISQAVFSSLQLLQNRGNKTNKPQAVINPPSQKLTATSTVPRSRPYWLKRRTAALIVNIIASCFLLKALTSTAPLARLDMVMIAFSAAVMAVCFVSPWIDGAYQYLELQQESATVIDSASLSRKRSRETKP